jgi:Fe-S oxidoreductase
LIYFRFGTNTPSSIKKEPAKPDATEQSEKMKTVQTRNALRCPARSAMVPMINPEIAQATARILNASGTPFMLMPDEWCCGNTLYSVGMIDEARALARRNIEAVKAAGQKQ